MTSAPQVRTPALRTLASERSLAGFELPAARLSRTERCPQPAMRSAATRPANPTPRRFMKPPCPCVDGSARQPARSGGPSELGWIVGSPDLLGVQARGQNELYGLQVIEGHQREERGEIGSMLLAQEPAHERVDRGRLGSAREKFTKA